ncbi:ABC transporter permease subunit [Treponema pedis]|uniref:ABC transporter permease n=2 Tax=Treponema pedis TaxID=409322 RepID=S5ZY91_9SPIR|nr:ABC transporter permease subunit [Treponema pedis]AGT42998.1 ABC transporter permease [Treponema pedis str. T A4]QOW60578.1 ABC transporter permease subunit [Treponema pedis]
MNNYFVRRLLLIIPTFIGITLVVFAVTRFVPGGPVERAIMSMMLGQGEGGGRSSKENMGVINEKTVADLQAFYGFDKPWPLAYADWFFKLLRGDMGRSTKYNDPVFEMIVSKFPVSLRFGIISIILVYMICIPLGVKKALKHRQFFDNASSVVIFIGYALPGYIVAIILLQFFAFTLNWFPSGGLFSRNYAEMSFFQKVGDNIWHIFLPMIAYMIGSFASMTITMKNNLMETMASDYVKTAVAKGRTFKDAMWKHAFRNSIIPIAAGLGGLITIFFSGAFLIEKIFNISGMGLLSFNAIEDRDYPVVLGSLVMTSLLSLLGNIISDFILSMVDPRIRLGE